MLIISFFFIFFFFFQAEDGIRDYKVTGVQTCALPISTPRAMRVNMLGLRWSRETQARWKKGQPHHRTTGVARTSCTVWIRGRPRREIGRASCRERVWMWGGAVAGKRRKMRRKEGQ